MDTRVPENDLLKEVPFGSVPVNGTFSHRGLSYTKQKPNKHGRNAWREQNGKKTNFIFADTILVSVEK